MSGLHYVLLLHGPVHPLPERNASTENVRPRLSLQPRIVWHDFQASQSFSQGKCEIATSFLKVADIIGCSYMETQRQL